ncbi:hypothetical protein [uncultured Mucilaginibacter sp.]|uniref:hypothetical protein n=1 Tax=uncultured Mucilaginibacter sp. TaxID=797541 RepID=UPI0025D07358|nr:hypothetical protein [uncultured Mucilaginibacter sp.]
MINKIALFSFFILLLFSRSVLAQEIIDTPIEHYIVYQDPKVIKVKINPPFAITGRVIGMNLENVQDVAVTNICTAETAKTDNNGIYRIHAAKGDTLAFVISKYSTELRGVKPSKENLNIILIKRKADAFVNKIPIHDYNKAVSDDNDIYHILEKDAKLEGKWVY